MIVNRVAFLLRVVKSRFSLRAVISRFSLREKNAVLAATQSRLTQLAAYSQRMLISGNNREVDD